MIRSAMVECVSNEERLSPRIERVISVGRTELVKRMDKARSPEALNLFPILKMRTLHLSNPTRVALSALLVFLFAGFASAAEIWSDFESDADIAAIRWGGRAKGAELIRSPKFATSGESSLYFHSPTWVKGQPEWPSFEWKPSTQDWSGYDRLVVDLVNDSKVQPMLSLYITDSKVPFREGLSHIFEVPSLGFHRAIISLSKFPKRVDLTDISLFHLFSERPPGDISFYFDQFTLLRPGEEMPEPRQEFLREISEFSAAELRTTQERIVTELGAIKSEFLRKRFIEIQETGANLLKKLEEGPKNLAELDDLARAAAKQRTASEHWPSLASFQREYETAGMSTGPLLIGLASSMEKVLPRFYSVPLQPAKKIAVSAARYEKESVQLVVSSIEKSLKKVSVTASDLTDADGHIFPASAVQCDVVGYVETTTVPPYGSPHVGWWPDPILNFLAPIDIAPGDLQSYWLRFAVPEDQVPGTYRGHITVQAEGVESVQVPVELKVRSFTLPKASPLPLAITFSPEHHPTEETRAAQEEWRQADTYPIKLWKNKKIEWVDFLADYYINYDSLYRHGPPEFPIIERLRDQGRLRMFNLGIFDRVSSNPEQSKKTLEKYRETYEKAKELGVLDKSYIYGFDEVKPEKFPRLEEVAQTLKSEFPDTLLMTTGYDHSYGLNSEVKTIDAWCPLTPNFNRSQAAKAREAGKEVWWYICCSPHHKYANMFIEYPAIEGRLLMGAMTAKERPDGFLYYQISIWNSQHPITSGPFTDWDPRSWTVYHGDGSWTCLGPDGAPVPTVRLENFRDGLEDYAYVRILEAAMHAEEKTPKLSAAESKKWLESARAALTVPEELVRGLEDYSRDPKVLYSWREHIADLIDQSGHADVDPWGSE